MVLFLLVTFPLWDKFFLQSFFHDGDPFKSLYPTLQGTGGALTGSMLTTVTGIGVLVLAITPILGQFGILIGLSIFYSYTTSIIILPPTLIIWHKLK